MSFLSLVKAMQHIKLNPSRRSVACQAKWVFCKTWHKNLWIHVLVKVQVFREIVLNKAKTEEPRDVRNSKVREQDRFRKDWSQHKNTCKFKSGIGPGVRRSKRPLLACRTHFKCSMEYSRTSVKKSNKVQISNRVKNWCNAWSMEGVTVDGHHPECRVTFGRGGPHIVW